MYKTSVYMCICISGTLVFIHADGGFVAMVYKLEEKKLNIVPVS